MKKINVTMRYVAALILLTLPLVATPWVWPALSHGGIVGFGIVKFTDSAVLALAALAAIVAAPERLWSSFQRSKLVRGLVLLSVISCGIVVLQHFILGGPWRLSWNDLFYILMPLAGIALARELFHIFPWYGGILFIVLALGTIRSSYCNGVVGNWNWNFSLLAVTLPGILLFHRSSKKRFWCAIALAGLGVIGIFIAFPEISPRGTATGLIGATALLGLLSIPRKNRWVLGILLAAGSFALFFSTVSHPDTANIRDTRIQMWRGALEFTLAHPIIGVGASRFESRIPPYLPHRYFLTDYPATSHPHPHNELLNVWSNTGLVGTILLALYMAAVLPGLNWRHPRSLWLGWSFLLLLIHGQFDVLLATPLAGTWFYLLAGTLSADRHAVLRRPFKMLPQLGGLILLLIAGYWAVTNYRSTTLLRQGRLELSRGRAPAAVQQFDQSLKIASRPETLYMAGQVALFDLHQIARAQNYFERLKTEWKFPSYLHLNNRLGRIYAVQGKLPQALHYFDLERQDFPFSGINAGLRLVVLQQLKAPSNTLQLAQKEFETNMEMRHLRAEEFPRLLKNQAQDDAPFARRP